MISFVWSSKYPFLAGAGGSENYTAGQIRELQRRGIPTRVLTLNHGEHDGREGFPDINFKALRSREELSALDDTLVFVTYPLNVPTRRRSYAILHCPPLTCAKPDPLFDAAGADGKRLIAPSKFAAKLWAKKFHVRQGRIPAAYPFAEPCFAEVNRPERTDSNVRILFAGRLTPDKGIYTLLAALHMKGMEDLDYELTVTNAGVHTEDGQLIAPLLKAHPNIKLIASRRTPQTMAALMAEHDIVVMPSTNIFWQEIFGIVSVEAQHAGCRVVASDAGGLPETDCGGLVRIKPDDPQALASGIARAAYMGPLTAAERLHACTKFTARQSIDQLLAIIRADEQRQKQQLPLLHKQGTLMLEQLDYAVNTLSHFGSRLALESELSRRNISNI